MPTEIVVKAYALGRYVDVVVADGTHVDLSGRVQSDHNESKVVPEAERRLIVRIEGHTFFGNITVRTVRPNGAAER